MMFRNEDDSRTPRGSQFAVRVTVLGGIALVVFAVIFFRLWYLEVLSGEAYLREANANRVRELGIQAPRGQILDSNGEVLVDNRTALSLQIRPDELPNRAAERNRQLRQLAEVAEMPTKTVKKEIRTQINELPASPVTLKRDVEPELVYFLRERQDEFPGVSVEEIFVRKYPDGTLASHILGYVSEINPEQLKEPIYDELESGDRIGVGGLEQQYDSILRGRDGAVRVQVDAFGQPRGEELSRIEPQPGRNLVLSLDKRVQKAGEQALAAKNLPGAFVAMDVQTGAVLGIGSYPTFEPSIFTPPASTNEIEALIGAEGDPTFNRATQGAYPTASTFKLITATAALEEGFLTPTETIIDDGLYMAGDLPFRNAGDAAYGPLQLQKALQVSSDVFFYTLGGRNEDYGGEAIQDWATQYGLGAPTGIDLPFEEGGTVPTPEWRNELFEKGLTDRPWSIGDSINLSIGQGDVQVTPLQLATAYAALGNGGSVVRPHLAQQVEDQFGRSVQEFDPEARRQMEIAPEHRQVIMDGMRDAAMVSGGTSAQVFGGFPIEIAGKTGTAERPPEVDQSWYAALAPYDNPRIVVVVTVEGGGFGAETAAPIARDILSAHFDVKADDVEEPVDPTLAGTVE